MAQFLKNPPQWPGFVPGWEDPLEEGMATHSGIPAWRTEPADALILNL